MERRNFLKGLLISASAAASTALVKLASPDDVRALTTGQPATLSQPTIETPIMPPYGYAEYVYMKDERGEFHPIGIVTELTVSAAVDEMLAWDGSITVTRPSNVDMRFTGPFAR